MYESCWHESRCDTTEDGQCSRTMMGEFCTVTIVFLSWLGICMASNLIVAMEAMITDITMQDLVFNPVLSL